MITFHVTGLKLFGVCRISWNDTKVLIPVGTVTKKFFNNDFYIEVHEAYTDYLIEWIEKHGGKYKIV